MNSIVKATDTTPEVIETPVFNHMNTEVRATSMAIIHQALASLYDHRARLTLDIQGVIKEQGPRAVINNDSWHGETLRLNEDLIHAGKVLESLEKHTDTTEAIKSLNAIKSNSPSQEKLVKTLISVIES